MAVTVFRAVALAALVLAGCERSDTNLRPEDIAARGDYVSFSETFTKPVRGGSHQAGFLLTCIEGSRLVAANARVVSVSGDRYDVRDMELSYGVPRNRNEMVAWVRKPGAAITGELPYVTVELAVGCALR